MNSKVSKPSLLKAGIAATVLLVASGVALAQSVSLTAKPSSTTLPDGQTAPMWGLFCNDEGSGGASCATAKTLPTAADRKSTV